MLDQESFGKGEREVDERSYDLGAIFKPGSVAVIGASDNPGKLGFHVMKSLTHIQAGSSRSIPERMRFLG